MAEPKSLSDVAILTKSIEFLVRTLIKILIGKISLVRLQELIERIFIEESENHIRKARPGRDVPLTKLALLTGLDTRKLARIRNSESFRLPLHGTRSFLKEVTPESCIIDFWTTSPGFTDPKTNEPLIVDTWGAKETFETLVRESVRARGVTVQSIIESMLANNLIRILEGDRIELKSRDFRPKDLRTKIGKIQTGLNAAARLLHTVHHNLEALSTGEDKLFQRASWTHRINPMNRDRLRQAVQEFLVNADDCARDVIVPFEDDFVTEEQLTAGIGMYYFEIEST